MVPDDSSTDDAGVEPSTDDTRAEPTTGDAGAAPTASDAQSRDASDRRVAGDRYDPDDDSGGYLSPGDDAPADLGDILLYGLLGGIAGSVLSFVPFATVLGGALAGYLCGGTSADALKTGAVAGAVMTLPFVAVVAFLLFLFGFAGAPAEFGVFALLVVGVGAAYTLGSGVVGGYLGHYLRGEL
ncbi:MULTISPECIES: DUF5518 domain-containing protein [unclassified Halorubrum]|uniref:DUF5518 domain-containing protein n=1 Tax=unclassified Halorubrum TaxID=2642239 RepID=UPI000BC6A805|nr:MULTISPECIES: DUF5518 domain-containing protein [unclassified Halorubrum]OYR39551.1 hypothetical protein DJ81_15980 [Halorubrum sp. Hd13]OYR40980.1 hypothetical protein DJ75_14470 [Halorubrum sp. Eb13]OYR49691.1 hypothetical protein DJ74_07770 [Halorubrum sp. Ea8]OYR51499.1 hypothetical protein DJ73_12940 [Halorubrum sp. Ea1]